MSSIVAKQLATMIDRTVSITIKHEKGVIRVRRRPGQVFGDTIAIQVEINAILQIREVKAITEIVDHDRTVVATLAATIPPPTATVDASQIGPLAAASKIRNVTDTAAPVITTSILVTDVIKIFANTTYRSLLARACKTIPISTVGLTLRLRRRSV